MIRLVPLFFLLAACAAGNSGVGGSGDFASDEVAPDAVEAAPRPATTETEPLARDELAAAALLVNRLADAETDEERGPILQALVALGPRYLAFLRSIENEALALDLTWVVSRIERESGAGASPVQPERARQPDPLPVPEGPVIDRLPPVNFADLPGDFDREQVERFIGARLKQATAMLDGGQTDTAVRIAEAALVLLPDTRYRPELDALVRRARNESQAELLIAGRLALSPDHLQYESRARGALFKEQLAISCFLKNVSAGEIRLTMLEPGRGETMLQLSVRYEQMEYTGSSMSQSASVMVPLDAGREVTLQPNETREIPVKLESLASLDADAPRKWALGRIHIEAALRIYGASDANGKALVLRPVPFPAASVFVFPHGFDLAENAAAPVNAVRSLLRDNKPQDAFMAAHLVRTSQLRTAGDLLTDDDFEKDALANQRCRLRAMASLFGTGASWDIVRWRRWWVQNRTRF